MKPEVRVLIQALRAGKREDAFLEYCWAKSVVPVRWDKWSQKRLDPMNCRPDYRGTMAMARALDALDDGATDEDIAQQFERGQAWDAENSDVTYRAARASEMPTSGDLLRAMGSDGLGKAIELFGVRNLADAILR